ncbi:retrotransposon protein, putative, ty1-copia subclass [Tanacetum coccineum]
MHVIEQPLPPAPEAGAEPNIVAQWTDLYDAHTEIACLMLGSMTPELHRQFELHYPYDMIQELRSMFEKQAGVEKFDLIQSFHACKQEEGKLVADYVLKIKGYVEQLERLGYMLPQDILVGLILNGLTKDFVGFVRNYNMHNMGKTIGEIHAMLIEYEKGLPKKAETPQVMMIKKWPAAKERQLRICLHHISKNGVLYFNVVPRNGIYEIDMHDLVPNVNSIYNVSNKRVKHNLDSTYLWHCRLAHINKKRIKQLQQDGLLKSTDDESFDKCESCLSGKMTKKPFPHSNERAKDLLGIIHTDVCGPLRLFQQLTPPYTPQHNGVSERRNRTLLDMSRNQWRAVDLEELQEEEDIAPSEITSNIPHNGEKYASLKDPFTGLKQQSRSWNKRFDEEIKRFGFAQNLDEPCVYQKASGSNVTFLILSFCMRLYALDPDVAFAQNITSRFQQNPGEPHWTAVKNILKYLRNTKDMFLVYGGNPGTELRVECYCDAGFETDRDDTKSRRYVFV